MLTNLTRKVLFAAVATIAALSASPTTRASEPEAVIRTFGFLVTPSLDQQIPDFLSDDSISVTISPLLNEKESLFFYATDDQYDGSLWVYNPARNTTKNGAKFEGDFYWLMTPDTPAPPPVGAFTFTGPDSFVLSQQTFYIDVCAGGECGFGTDGQPMLRPYVGFGHVFVVVTAVFSK